MLSDRKILIFFLSPLLVTLSYSLSVIGPSYSNFQIFLGLSRYYAMAVLTVWVLFGTFVLSMSFVREAGSRVRRPLPHFFGDLAKRAINPVQQIAWLTPPIVFILLMSAYGLFKQVLIPTSGYWAGPLLMDFEYRLLLQHHAWEVTHAALPIGATFLLDQAYQAWFVLMAGSMLICSYASGDPLQRCRFMLCFIATWIIAGSALAYLLPASGPIYFGDFQHMPDPFLALKAELAADDAALKASYGSGLLAIHGQTLLIDMLRTKTIFPGGGISAMPSMHNAIAILMACAGFSVNRVMGWLLSIFAALIFVGSVHLGWHYALDGVVAAMVSGGIWFSSGALLKRVDRRAFDRRTPPARRAISAVLRQAGQVSIHPILPVGEHGEPHRKEGYRDDEDRKGQYGAGAFCRDNIGRDEEVAELRKGRDQRDEKGYARPSLAQ